MNCQEVMELMQRQLDDDLDESEKEVLTNHTRQCPDCAAMFERLQLLSAELTSLPKVMPSYSLVDAIMPQLERIELFGQPDQEAMPASPVQSTEAQPRRKKRERRWPSLRIMSGVIAAGIVAGLFLVTYKSGSVPDFSFTNTAANESNNAAADSIAEAPQEFSVRSSQSESVKPDDISADSMKKDLQNDKSFMMNETESTEETAPAAGDSDPDKGSIPSIAEGTDGNAAGTDNHAGTANDAGTDGGGGMNSFEGSGGKPDGPKSGIASNDSAVISPDGKYSVKALGYSIKVYAESDQSLLFESPRKNGKPASLSWSEDSTKLTYEVHVENGAIEKYVIDLATLTEQKAAH